MAASFPALPPDERAGALHALLRRAGDAALSRLRSRTVRWKADGSRVTDADIAANEVLLEGLAAAWPGEAVRSEEGGDHGSDQGAVWYVDPLDGTGAFTEGLGHWGPTVCRVVGGKPDVGAFFEPRLGDFWFAAAGGGAWLDGDRLSPPEPGVGDASRSLFLPSRAHRLGPLQWTGRTRALGCSAAHLARVASGDAAAAIVPVWQPWDVACGVLLVREAGRAVTDLLGTPFDLHAHRGQPLLAAAPTQVQPLVQAVADALATLTGT